jgi:hypothetical protein
MNSLGLHYADVSFEELEPEDREHFVARFWRLVHNHNTNLPALRVGIDLPDWNPDTVFKTKIWKVRIFGDAGALTAFFGSERVKRIMAMGLRSAGILPTPSGPRVAVKRDTALARNRPSHQRRRLRRGHPDQIEKKVKPKLIITMMSESSHQGFGLALRKVDLKNDEMELELSSYGTALAGGWPQF